MDIERIIIDPDTVITALQQKYVESIPGEPAIRVGADGETEMVIHDDWFDQPDGDAISLRPERFVGDLDLPDPNAELDDEEVKRLGERLGSEVRPELREEVDINADREGPENLIPVEYPNNDP